MMTEYRLLFLLLFLDTIVATKVSQKRVGIIGTVKGEWKKYREMEIYPNVPYSFTIYGKNLPSDGYILTSRTTCAGLKQKKPGEIEVPLDVLWPPKERGPSLRVKNRFIVVRAKNGIPFEYDKYEKFYICHPMVKGEDADILIVRSTTSRVEWWKCILILIFLIGSAFCSGIGIAFFSYTTDELSSIIEASLDQIEKYYAQRILWYRQKSNYLICCFAAANCIFNVLLTTFCEDIFRNYRDKLVISTLASCCLTVIFGEILPQGVCSRYGLYMAAKTRSITLALFIVMAPFAWPLSKLIDLTLGREAREVLSRDQLKKLLTHHANNLGTDQESEILHRTVKFQDMTVRDIMKPLSDVFALSDHFKYTSDLALNLVERGSYSRIPIFSGKNRKGIYACINMSDLLNKPKDGTTIAQIMSETTSHLRFAPIDMNLQALSEEMKTGEHHMCVVFDYRADQNEVIGLVTSEDVWEQLFGDIQDDLDLAFGNKRTGIRKDQATLDWYKDKGILSCNQQLAIIQQLYNMCPELLWMGLTVHSVRHLIPRKLKRLIEGDTLKFKEDHIYVICMGEFEAEVVVISDFSTSNTKSRKKFHCNTWKNGRVYVMNIVVSELIARDYVRSFPSFWTEPPHFVDTYELEKTKSIVAVKDILYFTINKNDIINVVKNCVEEETLEYYDSIREPPTSTTLSSMRKKRRAHDQQKKTNRKLQEKREKEAMEDSQKREMEALLKMSKTQISSTEQFNTTEEQEDEEDKDFQVHKTQPSRSSKTCK